MNVNYKSDFAIFVNLDSSTEAYPWRVVFRSQQHPHTPPSGEYVAFFDGVNYHSAYRVEDEEEYNLVIELTNHALPPGKLVAEWTTKLDNATFESGQQLIVTPYIAPVELVFGESASNVDPVLMPYIAPEIKGEKGDKGDQGEKGDPGESGVVDVESLETDAATIDDDGVYVKPTPLSNNNVLGGLLAILDINASGELVNSWLHPDLGTYAYVTMTYASSSAYTVSVINGVWGYDPDEYNVIATAWQGEYTSVSTGGASVYAKTSTAFKLVGYNPYSYAFDGAHLLVYSTRHLWY